MNTPQDTDYSPIDAAIKELRCMGEDIPADAIESLQAEVEHWKEEWKDAQAEVERLKKNDKYHTEYYSEIIESLQAVVDAVPRHEKGWRECFDDDDTEVVDALAEWHDQHGHLRTAALVSREVCNVPHDHVEVCGYCQRDSLRKRVKTLEGREDKTVEAMQQHINDLSDELRYAKEDYARAEDIIRTQRAQLDSKANLQ